MGDHCESRCDLTLEGSVPECLSISLKTLIFHAAHNFECELKYLRYVVKNSKFLKQIKIDMPSRFNKMAHLERSLLDCPRASVACDISFFPVESSDK
ncbi:hypothetical protein PTKIN_Ptkin09bG0033100 [Pterospermum kingtungense]